MVMIIGCGYTVWAERYVWHLIYDWNPKIGVLN